MNSYAQGQTVSSGQLAPQNIARETHVQSQMQRQADVISRLIDVCKLLEDRLDPVLKPVGPENLNTGKDQAALVGHAMAISNQNSQLENIERVLRGILGRIEL